MWTINWPQPKFGITVYALYILYRTSWKGCVALRYFTLYLECYVGNLFYNLLVYISYKKVHMEWFTPQRGVVSNQNNYPKCSITHAGQQSVWIRRFEGWSWAGISCWSAMLPLLPPPQSPARRLLSEPLSPPAPPPLAATTTAPPATPPPGFSSYSSVLAIVPGASSAVQPTDSVGGHDNVWPKLLAAGVGDLIDATCGWQTSVGIERWRLREANIFRVNASKCSWLQSACWLTPCNRWVPRSPEKSAHRFGVDFLGGKPVC